MNEPQRAHGGLVFLSDRQIEQTDLRRIVRDVFRDHGQGPGHSDSKTRVVSDRFSAEVETQAVAPVHDTYRRIRDLDRMADLNQTSEDILASAALRVAISLTAHESDAPVPAAERDPMLADMLLRMTRRYRADYVEWLSPKALVPAETFFATRTATTNTRPRSRFQPLDEGVLIGHLRDRLASGDIAMQVPPLSDGQRVQEKLVEAFRTEPEDYATVLSPEERPSDALRLATWAMTGTVAVLSAPVAVSLSVMNLARGEDFRLNTHALSLTGLFAVLEANGALADVAAQLPF